MNDSQYVCKFTFYFWKSHHISCFLLIFTAEKTEELKRMKRICVLMYCLAMLMALPSGAFAQDALQASWASRDIHHLKTSQPPMPVVKDTVVWAWRGERVGVEAILSSPIAVPDVALHLSDWTKGSVVIPASMGEARWLCYVQTDDFRSCGVHPDTLVAYEVPDVIDLEGTTSLQPDALQPVWLTLEVPLDAEPGEYGMSLDVLDTRSGDVVARLHLRLNILSLTLPLPQEQAFHLDFWQQPYSVSRYDGVERWSDEHFELLEPYMRLLARAGQSVVTTILFYEPWGDQSHDKFSPMVKTVRRKDGTWRYDYEVFDRWVEFMAECGISKQINCYSMVPWDMTFRYYDEAQGRDVDLKTQTSTAEYRELWTAFLRSFARHLKEKGWFEKTLIAMDERGLGSMLDAYAVAQEAVPGLKMALAGNYHGELVDKLADYCLPFGRLFTDSALQVRRAKGWTSTVYTCCTESSPNLFTNSSPVEAAFLPVYAVANGFDGYLHWSWMNWPDQPLVDSRFRLFPPGDTFCIYPGPRSSVRWERFIEGVQQAEKIRILKEMFVREGDAKGMERFDAALSAFRQGAPMDEEHFVRAVNRLEQVLNFKGYKGG